ncbi:MAG: hypothetical protein ACTHJ7_01355 [Candidatus Nitrosocosmicus sp.]
MHYTPLIKMIDILNGIDLHSIEMSRKLSKRVSSDPTLVDQTNTGI